MAEALELSEEAFGGSFVGSAFGFWVRGGRPVQLAGLEHVVERDQDRVLDRADRDLVPGAGFDPAVLASEVPVLDADRAHRGVVQRAVEPFRALAGLPAAALAGGLVVAGALRRPAGEVLIGREAAHVGPELADQHLRGAVLDAVQRARELDGQLKRGAPLPVLALGSQMRLDRFGERGDLSVEEVDVSEDPADQHGVLGGEPDTFERLDQQRHA